MDIIGKVIHIGDTNQRSESFKTRDIVVETDEQYPQ